MQEYASNQSVKGLKSAYNCTKMFIFDSRKLTH